MASAIDRQRRVRSVRRSWPAPPLRVAARARDEGLADERLVGHAEHGLAAVVERDEHAPVQLAQHEALRPVDRIDDPVPRLAARLAPVLLADQPVGRVALAQAVADDDLGGAVGDGDGIVAAGAVLVLDVERGAEVRQDRAPGLLRGLPRVVERTVEVVHRRSYFACACPRMSRPLSFCCASISDGTYLSPKPRALAMTSVWCVASPMIDGSIIDSAKWV